MGRVGQFIRLYDPATGQMLLTSKERYDLGGQRGVVRPKPSGNRPRPSGSRWPLRYGRPRKPDSERQTEELRRELEELRRRIDKPS